MKSNIKGYLGYHISKRGTLYSRYGKGGKLTKGWKKKKNSKGPGGYLVNTLNHKTFYIHRLVALAYIPNPENKPYVCYKDNNRKHNHYKNLYWGTPLENMQQCKSENRVAKGKKNGMYGVHRFGHCSKLTWEQKLEIKSKFKQGIRIFQLAQEYSMSRSQIRRIVYNYARTKKEGLVEDHPLLALSINNCIL